MPDLNFTDLDLAEQQRLVNTQTAGRDRRADDIDPDPPAQPDRQAATDTEEA